MTANEDEILRKAGSTPGVAIARLLGLLGGLSSLGLGIGTFAGVTWDWDVFPYELIIVILIGLVGGGAAYSIRHRVNHAVNAGTVNEVQGTPQFQGNSKAPSLRVMIGTSMFLLPTALAGTFQGGMPVTMTWVQSGPSRRRGYESVCSIYVLAMNGATLPKPIAGYVAAGNASDYALARAGSMKK
jgi:hypothetical protein